MRSKDRSATRATTWPSFTLSLLGEDMEAPKPVVRPFPNLDGVRIITHNGGCGGTRADARSLCRILSAYADHPNVAGITVFSAWAARTRRSPCSRMRWRGRTRTSTSRADLRAAAVGQRRRQ